MISLKVDSVIKLIEEIENLKSKIEPHVSKLELIKGFDELISATKKLIWTTGVDPVQHIEEILYEAAGVTTDEMKMHIKNRKREYVLARQLHMAILHCVFNLSLAEAGKVYFKDHATVQHSVVVINNLIDSDKHFREKYLRLFSECYAINPKCIKLNIHYVIDYHMFNNQKN